MSYLFNFSPCDFGPRPNLDFRNLVKSKMTLFKINIWIEIKVNKNMSEKIVTKFNAKKKCTSSRKI